MFLFPSAPRMILFLSSPGACTIQRLYYIIEIDVPHKHTYPTEMEQFPVIFVSLCAHPLLLLSSEWLTNCSVFHLNACHPLDMCQHNLRSHISQSHEDLLMPHAVIPCAAEDTPHTLNHFGWGKRTTLHGLLN